MRPIETLSGFLLLILLLLATGPASSSAQVRNRVDNRGTQFRLAFLHTNGYDDNPRFFVDLWCSKATRGRLTYWSTKESVPINIPVPNTPIRIVLDSTKLILPNPKEAAVSNYSLFLEFDDEVVVYGANTQRWSTDAFVALPEEVLGTHYLIMSYPNTIAPDPTGELFNRSDFPSQFAIIATQDQTTVTIKPTVNLSNRSNTDQFSVLLNAGDIYFAQADNKVGLDLTGSEVRSNRPIVVYGSHQRTNIPFNEAVGRDHLVEQLLPVDRWTNRPIVTPHYQIPKTVNDANIIRVMAANDKTDLFIDSAFVRTLNAREFVELPLDRAKLLTASGPIQVAQYQHSTVDEELMRMENDSIGDPFMMLAFAPEQYDTAYAFESYQTKDFKYHFLNVVIPTERISSLTLDGNPVNASFSRIPKTSYSFAQLPVSAGFHRMKARAPFGLYIYGYGPYNSYGVPGAVVFDTLFKDQKPPLIGVLDTCGGVLGAAYDDSTYDFGMESVRLVEKGSDNVKLVPYGFEPGADSAKFRVDLIDPYQDGTAEIIAVDTAGLDSRVSFPVKGFTVSIQTVEPLPVTLDTLASLNGLRFCARIRLYNYGSFPQTITGLNLSQTRPGLLAEGEFPMTLAPGESREVAVCYQSNDEESFTVGISVTNGCLVRPLADLPVISGLDTLLPVITTVDDPCAQDKIFEIRELGARNAGIKTIIYHELKNAEPIETPKPPSKQMTLTLRRIDPRQDLIYSIEVEDLVGNRFSLKDTIGGFTLKVQRLGGEQVGMHLGNPWDYEEVTYGEEVCDTVVIENYGTRTLDLTRIRLLGNLEYSIPPAQLPFNLNPGEVKRLGICFRPRGVGEKIDTLSIEFGCVQFVEQVQLYSLVDPLGGAGRDKCGNAITFQVGGFAKRNFLEPPTPNPVGSGTAAVTFGLTRNMPVTMSLHDGMGNEVRRLLDRDPMPAGIARIDMNVADLEQGMYYLRMWTADGDAVTQKLVISR